MTRLVLFMTIALVLTACSTHRAVRVRCTDRLEPINRSAAQHTAPITEKSDANASERHR